ncbi:DNA helicase Pif1-like protein [Artemisia annua]|uniref:DNA helicase Pif1-like protein n=1 Tax=Artemisia annua TaxID=35608 RepID=A0A2U1KAN5_ARTAN|nr:DNA helicase Pif1-like protein [Artemisia annua]
MAEADIPQFKVRLFGVVGSRQHELPAGDSIGAIVFEGGPDVETDFDVVIEQHDRTLKRVNKLNASYMSLQFPLIFFFGQDGYHLGRLLLNRGTTDDPPKKMSMKMYYSYELHDRPNERMEPNSNIGLSPNSKGKEIVPQSQDTALAKVNELDASQAIIAQSGDITLADIKESDAGKPLQVRVYRKWTPTNKQGKLVMFCCILIDRQEATKAEIEIQPPTNTTVLHGEGTTTVESKDNEATPPTEQLSLSETSEPKKEATKKTDKRQLFNDDKGDASTAVTKKSKKSA